MRIHKIHILKFRCFDDSGDISLGERISYIIGLNESGKSSLLQALWRLPHPQRPGRFDPLQDYPRKQLASYYNNRLDTPLIAQISFKLDSVECDAINVFLGCDLVHEQTVLVNYYMDRIEMASLLPVSDYIQAMSHKYDLNDETVDAVETLGDFVIYLADNNCVDEKILNNLKEILAAPETQGDVLSEFIWQRFISRLLPRFELFDRLPDIPDKINLSAMVEGEGSVLLDQMLSLAQIPLAILLDNENPELVRANLERLSEILDKKILHFWTQNNALSFHVDVSREKTEGSSVYSTMLNIRVKDKSTNLTTPIGFHGLGFKWFVCFFIWLEHLRAKAGPAMHVFMLDEPGRYLHAEAQRTLNNYLRSLSNNHQILVATHSDYLLEGQHEAAIKLLENDQYRGAHVVDLHQASHSEALLPYRNATVSAWLKSILTHRFNIVVREPHEILYLQYFSNVLKLRQKEYLPDSINIVCLPGISLEILQQLSNKSEQHQVVLLSNNSQDCEQARRHSDSAAVSVLCYQAYSHQPLSKNTSGVEALIDADLFINFINEVYRKDLAGSKIRRQDLPDSGEIIENINLVLKNNLSTRQDIGLSKIALSSQFVSTPALGSKLDVKTVNRFEKLFSAINAQITVKA